MTTDKRRSGRYTVPAQVKVTWANGKSQFLKSRNVSDGGVFLEGAPDALPEEGTAVNVQVTEMLGGGEAPILSATVVRVTPDGIGLRFDN